jgi:hypothetical protein
MGRLVVVVPLREGVREDAVDLLRRGPPLDLEPSKVQSFLSFVTDREAILVLEGPWVGRSDGLPWQELSAWRDGERWKRCAESPPRLGESVH